MRWLVQRDVRSLQDLICRAPQWTGQWSGRWAARLMLTEHSLYISIHVGKNNAMFITTPPITMFIGGINRYKPFPNWWFIKPPKKLIWWGWGFKFCKHISGKHQIGLYKTKHVAFEQEVFRHTKSTHPTPLLLGPGAPGASTSLSLIIKFEISIWIPKFQYHRKWYLWNQLKPSEINWNHRSANFSTKRKKITKS